MKKYGLDLSPDKLPRHVAIIMDGNGRWAKKRNMERIRGHEKGYKVLKEVTDFNKYIGVKYISVYAFSTENWKRPANEIDFLMRLAETLIVEYTDTLIKNDVKLMITGTNNNLDPQLITSLNRAIERTSHCKSYTLNIVFNYGGRMEIIDAAKKLAIEYKDNKLSLDNLDEALFHNYLYQPGLPDVDLLIRTSGELRISNFLLWQNSYSEFWITKKLWPDFTPRDYCKAIKEYQKRNRRFGGV